MTERSVNDRIEDCWNRIGVRGDRSCERLAACVHCHHCEIHAGAAKRILDLFPLQLDAADSTGPAGDGAVAAAATEPVLVFRLGEDWLGLPLGLLAEVSPVQPVHSLPHRRSEAVLGVSHLRGGLTVCLSLAAVLGLPVPPSDGGRAVPRVLVISNGRESPVACPVDEVDGVHAVPHDGLSGRNGDAFSRACFVWKNRSIVLLDENHLWQAIGRSLA